jgi:hypothetical protein
MLMSSMNKRLLSALTLVGAAVCFASHANAGCSYSQDGAAEPWLQGASLAPGFVENHNRTFFSIVGLWHVVFTANNSAPIPDGTVIDNAIVTWHADGTEIMNSGKPPITSSFCMGVWEPNGPGAYKLKHIALGWDLSGTQFLGQVLIKESVRLNRRGDRYTGTFSIDQFSLDGTTVTSHVAGNVAATRITVD